jgi:hypothetical protein
MKIPKINAKSLVKSKKGAIALASALSGVAGAAVGYTLAVKKLETVLEEKYRKLADEEVEKTRQFYRAMQKPETPQEAAREAGLLDEDNEEDMAEYNTFVQEYVAPKTVADAEKEMEEEAKPMEEVEEHNIFTARFPQVDEDPDAWNYDEQLALRAELVPGTPYIISEDEYYQNEHEYEQVALTYFAEDDVLCDEKDIPIDEIENTVGGDHLTKFGFGSNNDHMVFVRNDRTEIEFEITKSDGSYKKEVAGFTDDDELKHSAGHGVRKFRDWHDE